MLNDGPKQVVDTASTALTFDDILKMQYSQLNRGAGADLFKPKDFIDSDSDDEILK